MLSLNANSWNHWNHYSVKVSLTVVCILHSSDDKFLKSEQPTFEQPRQSDIEAYCKPFGNNNTVATLPIRINQNTTTMKTQIKYDKKVTYQDKVHVGRVECDEVKQPTLNK